MFGRNMQPSSCLIVLLSITLLTACGKETKVEQSAPTVSVQTTNPSIEVVCSSMQDHELGLKNGLRTAPPCDIVKTELKQCVGEYSKESWTNCLGERSMPGGSHYLGGYLDGKAHGKGEFINEDGTRFIGEYAAGFRNGAGVEYSADGTIQKQGKWIRGLYDQATENNDKNNSNVVKKEIEPPPDIKLDKNQERGQFLAKCYAMGVMVMKSDSEASPSDIEKIKKWAMKISGASLMFISEKEFDSIVMAELKYIAKTRGYMRPQVLNCTSILGNW